MAVLYSADPLTLKNLSDEELLDMCYDLETKGFLDLTDKEICNLAEECRLRGGDDHYEWLADILYDVDTQKSTEILLESIHEDSTNTFDVLLLCALNNHTSTIDIQVYKQFLHIDKSPSVRETASRIIADHPDLWKFKEFLVDHYGIEKNIIVKVNLACALFTITNDKSYWEFLQRNRSSHDFEVAREVRFCLVRFQ